jgi:hypothetical protein
MHDAAGYQFSKYITHTHTHTHTHKTTLEIELWNLILTQNKTFSQKMWETTIHKTYCIMTDSTITKYEVPKIFLVYCLNIMSTKPCNKYHYVRSHGVMMQRYGIPHSLVFMYLFIIIFSGSAAQRGLWPHRPRGFVITHNDAPQSVGLLWTSDQLVAETSTWQHTTHTTDRHPCPRWDSNLRSQQAKGRRPTP